MIRPWCVLVSILLVFGTAAAVTQLGVVAKRGGEARLMFLMDGANATAPLDSEKRAEIALDSAGGLRINHGAGAHIYLHALDSHGHKPTISLDGDVEVTGELRIRGKSLLSYFEQVRQTQQDAIDKLDELEQKVRVANMVITNLTAGG